MPNRLASETSPYLLQHADNPVDWYPWGDEAFARAQRRGQAACWSRSATRRATGATSWSTSPSRTPPSRALMNERFVCIKVDREERPDVDAIYMDAVQAMTGQGGWPLNAFLTPDGDAVLRRHLLPAAAAAGLPSWRDVLSRCANAWDDAARGDRRRRRARSCRGCRARRMEAPDDAFDPGVARAGRRGRGAAAAVRREQRRLGRRAEVPADVGDRVPAGARRARRCRCRRCAGWPRAASTTRSAAASPATRSTPRWLVPHFEKMLYDNALLARAYLHAWQITERRACSGACARRRSTGRCASCGRTRAGSPRRWTPTREGVEGKFYVWTLDEIRAALGRPRRRRDRATSA